MLKVNKYKLESKKIKNKQKILLIADIHLCDDYDEKIISNILEKVEILKPNIICLCGDIIDEFRFFDKKQNEKFLLDFLNNLSKFAPTLITLGSHDYFNLKKFKINGTSSDAILYWQNLIKKNNNKNVLLLHNQIFENDDLRVIGYTPSRDYFQAGEDSNVLVSELNSNFFFDKKDKKYTILMCHSPRKIEKSVLFKVKFYSTIDLVLSGHMHDGLVFPILKKLPTSIGIISPQRTLFPKNTRGKKTIKVNNHIINLIITGGVLKFSNASPNFFHKLNCLYNQDIDYIEVDN